MASFELTGTQAVEHLMDLHVLLEALGLAIGAAAQLEARLPAGAATGLVSELIHMWASVDTRYSEVYLARYGHKPQDDC